MATDGEISDKSENKCNIYVHDRLSYSSVAFFFLYDPFNISHVLMSSIRLSEGQRKCHKFLWAPAHVCVYSKGLLTWLSQKRSGFWVLIVIPEKTLGPETSGISTPPFSPPLRVYLKNFLYGPKMAYSFA